MRPPLPRPADVRRFDPSTGDWVTYADHRQDRTYLPDEQACPLCPTRPGGPSTEVDAPSYEVAVFDNRFPALVPDPPLPAAVDGPYAVAPARGRCEVVVYSDQHDATLAGLGVERAQLLVDVWADRFRVLAGEPGVAYVLPFENRGTAVGVTLHHPHGQVYAYPDVPPRVLAKLEAARTYAHEHGRCVHCDVVAHESAVRERVVAEVEGAIAFVPFAARFPYEVRIVPTTHAGDLVEAGAGARRALGTLLHRVVSAYDALFGFPLPYVLSVHQRPVVTGWEDLAHVHVELSPPHRAPERLKHLAGSELAAGAFLGDVLPEVAAERLREAAA
jgi:UDPglucose--hexose-1-phosphate uridylyltransferase